MKLDTNPLGGVVVRTLVVGHLPLLVVDLAGSPRGDELHALLVERGLATLTGFLGVAMPKGAKVGFVVDGTELRLVDERDTTLLRAPRDGVADDWLEAARRLKGTMTVVVPSLDHDPTAGSAPVVRQIDEAATAGTAIGAIIGVVEERPTLPLLF